MRQESQLRTALVLLLASVIPCMVVGSTFAWELSDLILPLGPPLTQFFHAGMLFIACFAASRGIGHLLSYRTLRRYTVSAPVGTTIPRMVDELSSRLGLQADVRVAGGIRGGVMASTIAGRRRIILIPAARLTEAKTKPAEFRFRLAHELTHLATNDPRTDRWIASIYIVAALFVLAALCRVLWNVAEGVFLTSRFGVEWVWWSIRGSSLALVANTVAFSSLGTLLLLEHRAAVRLREFHADFVARTLVGPVSTAFAEILAQPAIGLRAWLGGLLSDHPVVSSRERALTARAVALNADQVMLVIQGFFGATVAEFTLQLLLVGASAGISSLPERSAYLATEFFRYPRTEIAIITVAVLLCSVSQFVVTCRIGALAETQDSAAREWRWGRGALLISLGACLALLSSQTFLWEMSSAGWNPAAWIAQDPERPAIYTVGIAASLAIIISVMMLVRARGTAVSVNVAGAVSSLPALSQLGVAALLLGIR